VTQANGTALFTTPALSVGTHSITASYAGDFNFVPLTSAVLSQNVNADANFAVSNSPVSEVVPGAIVKLFPTSINFGT
jgi:Bacterial Ig-like domain (group 3)